MGTAKDIVHTDNEIVKINRGVSFFRKKTDYIPHKKEDKNTSTFTFISQQRPRYHIACRRIILSLTFVNAVGTFDWILLSVV